MNLHRLIRPLLFASLALATTATGCMMEMELGADTEASVCRGCGDNDDQYNDHRFGQFMTDGTFNQMGVAVVNLEVNGVYYQLDAIDNVLVGRTPTGAVGVAGPQLVGGHINLEVDNGGTIEDWVIDIESILNSPSLPSDWSEMGRSFTYYFFRVGLAGQSGRMNLCVGSSVTEYAALVTKGERYRFNTGVVAPPLVDNTNALNLGCGDHALQKMILLGYAQEITDPVYATTPEQRQATLRMIRADYAGDGTSYTETGRELWWQNYDQWVIHGAAAFRPANSLLEAYWTADGAACANVSRVYNLLNNVGSLGIPNCSGFDPAVDAWEWVTYVVPDGP